MLRTVIFKTKEKITQHDSEINCWLANWCKKYSH